MKSIFVSSLVLFFSISAHAMHSCRLGHGLSQPRVTLAQVTPSSDYTGELDGTRAAVSFHYDGSTNEPKIEAIEMIDSVSGVTVRSLHNAQTASNVLPMEESEIQTGSLVLDLGTRGIFSIICDLRPD